MDGTVHGGLHPQTASVHSAKETHVQSLLDWFEKIHHQMVRDVVGAEREIILVLRPTAFHQLRLQPFVLEEPFFVSGVDWRFASQPDKTNADVL